MLEYYQLMLRSRAGSVVGGGIGRAAAMSLRYYDIGLNLTDPMFRGVYNGKQYHENDTLEVLNRAQQANVASAMLTGSSIAESREAIELCHEYKEHAVALGYTVGVHPCCVNEFVNADARIDSPSNDQAANAAMHCELDDAHENLAVLYRLMEQQLASDPQRFKAIGEIGLDYDRFHYSGKEMQLIFFEEQLKLSCLVSNPRLPLFLHMRSCCDDFVTILRKFVNGFHDHEDRFKLSHLAGSGETVHYKFDPERKFVIHSFTGSLEELQRLLDVSPNSFIGINGCSLKSAENLECASAVPIDRLLLETDAPWCDIRRTHSSYKHLKDYTNRFNSVKKDKLAKLPSDQWSNVMVKSRNEPCTMEQVAIVVADLKKMDLNELVDQVWSNTTAVFDSNVSE